MPKIFKPPRQLVIQSSLVVALMVLCRGGFAAETDYKDPDPKVIAKVNSIAPSLQAALCRKTRRS